MDARVGMLIGGGTAVSMALAVTCTLLLTNAAALSNHPGRPLASSSITVPQHVTPAATSPSHGASAAVAPAAAVPAVPAPPAASVAPSPPPSASPHALTVPAPPAQAVAHMRPAVHKRSATPSARVESDLKRLRADLRAAAQRARQAAQQQVQRVVDDMQTPALRAGHWSGPEHPRAGTGLGGR